MKGATRQRGKGMHIQGKLKPTADKRLTCRLADQHTKAKATRALKRKEQRKDYDNDD
jgi:hypothetical protein